MQYDLRILRPQCFRCNIHYGGMTGTFRENMKFEIGEKEEQKLFNECSASKGKPIKADIIFYANKINEYQKINDLL